MSNFDRWPDDQLQKYLHFCGKEPKKKSHADLVEKAKKLFKKDPASYERFQMHWAGVSPGSAPSAPAQSSAPNPYGAPPGGNPYGTAPPGTSPYGAPAASPYGAPAASPYGAPAASPYGAPAASPYGAAPNASKPAASPYGTGPYGAPAAQQPSYPPSGGEPAVGYPMYPAQPAGHHGHNDSHSAPFPGGGKAGGYPASGGGGGGGYGASGPMYNSSAAPPASASGPMYPGAGPAPGASYTGTNGHSHGQGLHNPYGNTPGPAVIPGTGSMASPSSAKPTHPPNPTGGRKKALLIGCNYPGTRAALGGCVNDALCMEYLLKTKFGFQAHDIRVLRDDQGRNLPTGRNIREQIHWLMSGASAGDSLVFHFSGHGSQKRDWSGTESDGMNETICPSDFQRHGQIVDDELNKLLVNPLPTGCKLHCVIDACHSGTAMDLPYQTKIDKYSGAVRWQREGDPRRKGTRGGICVQFGACKDSQTAADTSALSHDKTRTGAATFLFIQAIENLSKHGLHHITYKQVIDDMQRQIKKALGGKTGGRVNMGGALMGGMLGAMLGDEVGMMLGAAAGGLGMGGMRGVQKPQLSASEPMDLNMTMHI